MADRGSQQAGGTKAPCDALSHTQIADAVVDHVDRLPLGSVIAIQGSWGRGKTDVMARVFDRFKDQAVDSVCPEPVWINPWQYGTPDLIRPVVLTLLARLREQGHDNQRILVAANTLLRAASAMMFKAVSVVVPFGEIIGAVQPVADEAIKDWLGPGDRPGIPDDDPVAAMAGRFRELVEEVLRSSTSPYEGRLVVCVDDLDRCLPQHQVAMLEAIHFLTSADANCSFVVALDPVNVQEAAAAYYRHDGFDSNQYLDKLFQLRVNLAALRPDAIDALINAEFKRLADLTDDQELDRVLHDGLAVGTDDVRRAFSEAFFLPELTNPRLVHRVFDRLRLAATANASLGHDELQGPRALNYLVVWCAIAERWPQLRQILQASHPEKWDVNLRAIGGSPIWTVEG